MSTVELNDHTDDRTVARHREGTDSAPECRRVFEPVTAGPRESDRHIGRTVQIDAWIGPMTQRDASVQDLTGTAVSARAAVVDVDPGTRAGNAELSRPLGQDAAGIRLEPSAASGSVVPRLTRSDGNVMR